MSGLLRTMRRRIRRRNGLPSAGPKRKPRKQSESKPKPTYRRRTYAWWRDKLTAWDGDGVGRKPGSAGRQKGGE